MGFLNTTGYIADGSITTSKIKDKAITEAKIDDNAVSLRNLLFSKEFSKMAYKIIELTGVNSLSESGVNDWNGMIIDSFTDENGYNNTIDTISTTAGFVGFGFGGALEKYKFDFDNNLLSASVGANSINTFGSAGVSTSYTKLGDGSLHTGQTSSDYATLQNSNVLEGSNWAISFWLYTSKPSSSGYVFLHKENGISYHQGGVNYAGEFVWYSNDGTTNAYVKNVISFNQWVHIVIQRNTTTGRYEMYYNGSLVSTYSTLSNPTFSGQTFYIGRKTDGSSNWENYIDDLRFYDTALTSSQISTLYNSGNGTKTPLPSTASGDVITNTLNLNSTYQNFYLYLEKDDTLTTTSYLNVNGSYQTIQEETATRLTTAINSTNLKINISGSGKIYGYSLAFW